METTPEQFTAVVVRTYSHIGFLLLGNNLVPRRAPCCDPRRGTTPRATEQVEGMLGAVGRPARQCGGGSGVRAGGGTGGGGGGRTDGRTGG